MSRLNVLRNDFANAIKAALGNGVKIYFGQPTKPNGVYPQCVVRFALDRRREGRQISEKWRYEIEVRLDKSTLADDTEITLYEQADLIIQQIEPFTEDAALLSSLPKPPIRSHWDDPRVESVTPQPADDSSTYRAVRISGDIGGRVLS